MKVEWGKKTQPAPRLYSTAELCAGLDYQGRVFCQGGEGYEPYMVVMTDAGRMRLVGLEGGNRFSDKPQHDTFPEWREVQARVVVDGFAD